MNNLLTNQQKYFVKYCLFINIYKRMKEEEKNDK